MIWGGKKITPLAESLAIFENIVCNVPGEHSSQDAGGVTGSCGTIFAVIVWNFSYR